MENVVLVVHLLLALGLIGVVLLQRSEGGGLGLGGGGGGGGGLVSSRGAATALGKITWGLAIAFICTSLALTIFAAQGAGDASVLDRLGTTTETDGTDLLPPAGEDLLPPPAPDATETDRPRAE